MSSHGSRFYGVLAGSVLLICCLLSACGESVEPSADAPAKETEIQKADMELTLSIEGMVCPNCVNTVTRVLSACPGVVSADVSLEENRALVKGNELDSEALIQAVVDAGGGIYKVSLAE